MFLSGQYTENENLVVVYLVSDKFLDEMTRQFSTIRVICLGNPLHGNDGVGYQVLQQLKNDFWPENVELIDGGTGGLTLLPWFGGCDRVVLVDAIIGNDNIANVEIYQDIDVEGVGDEVKYDDQTHGGNLKTLLAMLPIYLEKCPRVDLIGIVCNEADYFSQHISPEVMRGIPALCNAVHKCVHQ